METTKSQKIHKFEKIIKAFSRENFYRQFQQEYQRAQLDVTRCFFLQFFVRQVRWSVTPNILGFNKLLQIVVLPIYCHSKKLLSQSLFTLLYVQRLFNMSCCQSVLQSNYTLYTSFCIISNTNFQNQFGNINLMMIFQTERNAQFQ